MGADQTGLDLAADQEHGSAGAVIGASAAVFLGPPAELGKGHHEQPILVAARRQVLVERGHGVGNLLEQVGVGVGLVGVRIEAVDGDVKDARPQVGVDQLSGELELV